MDLQKQKLKNRLNLRFQPLQNHPTHRYSLKKLSLDKQKLQKSTDQDNSQLNLLPTNRNKSISAIKLPSLQKITNTANTVIINNQISPVKKNRQKQLLNMLAAKQKLIKLNKLQKNQHDVSIMSSAVGNISKINYGNNYNPISSNKNIQNIHQVNDVSILNTFDKNHNQSISSNRISMDNTRNQIQLGHKQMPSVLLDSKLSRNGQRQKNHIQKTEHLQSKQSQTSQINNNNKQSQIKVKVQSKASIHQTLTFLIKNQILTIPKIVALLQKSHSDQFLYMKIRGIYQYEVCDEIHKGSNFVTVSRNGMVIDGELISLEKLVHQFQFYKKLRKISFFKYFLWNKFMNKWSKGSKKAQFIQNRNNIYKLLNLDNVRLMKWGIELKQQLTLTQKGGSLTQKWITKIANSIVQKKNTVYQKLTKICYQMLYKFDLPISDSTELMNKVLKDLGALNLNFQTKIRIQKEIQIFYRFARGLQFYFIFSIGQFALRHIQSLCQKIYKNTTQYANIILAPLSKLDIESQKYPAQKQQILNNSPLNYDMQFKMLINDDLQSVQIHPSTKSIHKTILQSLQSFYLLIQKQSFKLVRNQDFKFILNVVNKNIQIVKFSQQKPFTIKDYIYTLSDYFPLLDQLQGQIQQMEIIYNKRIQLNKPFLNLYKQLKYKNSLKFYRECFYIDFENEFKYINQKKQFCHRLHDGQYFIFGYLDQTHIKNKIFEEIEKYELIISKFIPQMSENQKKLLQNQIKDHLSILSVQISSPDIYIKVSNENQKAQEKLSQYSAKILELQKIGELYSKVYRKQLVSLQSQKSLLAQLRSKIKNFKQIRQNIYLQYRRQLQLQRKNYVQRVQKLSIRQQCFYIRTQQHTTIQIHQKIKQIITFLSSLNKQIKHFNQLEIFFNLKQTFIPKLEILLVEYETLQEIWRIFKDYQYGYDLYIKKNVFKIAANKEVLTFDSYLRKIQKYIKNIEYYQLCKDLQQKLHIYLDSMQFISQVQFQALRDEDFNQMNKAVTRQWQKMKKNQVLSLPKLLSNALNMLASTNSDIKFQIEVNVKQLTLQKIMLQKHYENKHLLQQITFKCRKQLQIKQMLSNFQSWWKGLKLQGKPLQQYPLIIIFSSNDHVRREIDQYTTILLNILNHKYGAFIRKQCTNYLKNMTNLTQLLRLTIQHQEKFLSLYPILTSKYAQKQLIQQYKKFDQILTKTMKNVRWLIKPTQNLNDITKNLLINHIKHFDSISKYLSDFLQKKRVKFQRFYFLQDNQMLQVLVGNQNPNSVFRMFEGIKGWLQDENGVKIGVIGVGGQQLYLKGWVYKNNQPQLLFRSLQQSIKSNLNSIVRQVLHSYQAQLKQLKTLYPKVPWMCIYTIQLILYTKQIELNCFYDHVSFQLQKNLIKQTINAAAGSPSDNSNYITLLLFLLHFTEQLQKQNVTSVFHFQWYSFLKYYHEDNQVVMRAMGAEHSWGGQYQGLWSLMINTSDIRRVNACVLGNLKNSNGVLLQGPSGTGKTQSLKQLSRCMAKHCVIFNCSSDVNIQTLQKLLSGLCYTASWICLDQINRLTAEIMSVIANQITTIKNALLSGRQNFNFMGKKMQIKRGIGVFSTMNPIYLKRAKLTQNLKSYFRVISVNAPDYEKILQVMLYSLNYSNASNHAKKIARLFKNLSFQLGNHLQYDFGMRAMKVFVKKLSKYKSLIKKQQQTIFHALYQTFHSRLNPNDTKTFDKVIKDILGFSLQNYEIILKVESIKQSTQTGTIILGPTSCKTTLINSYLQSFKQKSVNLEIFNCNSVQSKYFLGESLLGRWIPGIVQNMTRKCLQNQHQMHVLVLDNKLKSQIIQNFNTLLDQSKLLTLANGTRLKVHDNFKLIMQTPDLTMTSPATITRCHVVYVCLQDVYKNQIITSVLPKLDYTTDERIRNILIHFTIEQILNIGKIYPLFWNISLAYKTNKLGNKVIDQQNALSLVENQVKGLEKVIFYAIQLLNLYSKVKNIITKQNTVPLKRPAYYYTINFQKYQQGQFIQTNTSVKPENNYFSYFIPTVPSQFCKKVIYSAITKNLSVLWSGKSMIGKSTCIKRGISHGVEAIVQRQKKLVRVPVDKYLDSKKIAQIVQQRISIKNSIVNDQVIIYVDNINLCMEQSEQSLRFLSQYGKFFAQKTRQVIQIKKLSRIADCNNLNKRWSSRMARHFAQIQFPELSDNQAADIYAHIIRLNVLQTRTTSYFKQNLQIEMDKLVVFLTDYVKKKNKLLATNNSHLKSQQSLSFNGKEGFTYFQLLNSLSTLKGINQKFVQQPADLMQFLLCEMRREQTELTQFSKQENHKILDLLKLAFNQSYKQKFQDQYNHSLKTMVSHPKNVRFYSNYMTGSIDKVDSWQAFKSKIYAQLASSNYLSQFMVVQLIYIMRTIQYRGGNYILIGKEGVGKKNILKMAANICQCKLIRLDEIQYQKLSQIYFAILKQSFLKNKKVMLALNANCKNFEKFMLFLQRIMSNYPLKFLFKNQQIDEAYTLMENLQNQNYQKSIKSYDSIVQDFFNIARQNVHLFITCRKQHIGQILNNFHYINRSSTVRLIQDFPSESILQISQRILQDKIVQKQNAKRLSSTFLKLYQDLSALIDQNIKSKGYSYFKYNAICHFKFVEKYIQHQRHLIQKIKKKEDLLNRSIVKIELTQKLLIKIKQQNIQFQQEIKSKQQILTQSSPYIEQKRQKYEKIKDFLDFEKKQIHIKVQQENQIKTQIEQKLAACQPYLKQAMDCILSIKRAQIAQFKSSVNIHPLLKFTLENMIILLGQNQTQQNFRKIIVDPNLILRLKNCSPRYEDCLKIKQRIQQKSEWNFQAIAKLAFGLRYLFKWIMSNLRAAQIKNSIEIKKLQLLNLQKQIKQHERITQAKYAQLIVIQGQLSLIQDKFNVNKNQLLKSQQKLARNNRKLQNADKVKEGLNIYMENWKQKIKKGKQIKKNIQYVSTIYTFFLKIHPFLLFQDRKSIQQKLQNNLRKALFSIQQNFKPFDYLKKYLEEAQIQKQDEDLNDVTEIKQKRINKLYNIKNVPHEDTNNQNIVSLLYNIQQRPILFDPDNQALKWLQLRTQTQSSGQGGPKMLITKHSFTAAQKNVQLAIKQGYLLILLIQDSFDDFTSQILNSKITYSMNRRLIQYNKNLFYIHPNFRIILCNKNRKPNPAVSFFISHQVINFEVTKNILKLELLNQILMVQAQLIYKSKINLQIQKKNTNQQLSKIQSTILDSLINNKKQLVQDDELINLLQKGEQRSYKLVQTFKSLDQKMLLIQKQTKLFQNVCSKASQIFLSLKYMSRMNQFFSWNVQIFIKYFLDASLNSISNPLLEEVDEKEDFTFAQVVTPRVQNFQFDNYIGHGNSRATSALSYVSAVTSKIPFQDRKQDFQQEEEIRITQSKVSNNIFKKKQQVKFDEIMKHQQMIVDQQRKGTMNKQREDRIIQKILYYLKHPFNQNEKKSWALILCLINCKQSQIKILFTAHKHKDQVKDYIEGKQITKNMKQTFMKLQKNSNRLANQVVIHPTPFSKYASQFSQLQILILCKLLKPQRFNQLSMQLFQMKGYSSILQYEKVDVSDWFAISDNVHPILLMMGEDPLPKLTQFLGTKRYKNVILLAMGQGQSKIAQIVLQKQSRKQNIVIIHNLHISPQFYGFLSKTLQQFQTKKPHPNFRLMLITSLTESFDISIASSCHKFLVLQPQGVKNQMKYLYQHFPVQLIEPNHKKIGFSICLFHSVINQLQKYKSQGWNMPYDFNTSDFVNSIKILKEIIQSPLNLEHYKCNIDQDELDQLIEHKIDFDGLRYLIGQVNYVGKLVNQFDRQKMRIFVNTFLNQNILQEGYKLLKSINIPKRINRQQIIQSIKQIGSNNPKFYGLHENTKKYAQSIQSVLQNLKPCFASISQKQYKTFRLIKQKLPEINHRFQFINSQIKFMNDYLHKQASDNLDQDEKNNKVITHINVGNYQLLKLIKVDTKVFDLKSFSNPHQFFTQIQKQSAIRLQTQFQKVQIVWTLVPKDNVPCYGIKNLKLQGAILTKKEGYFYIDYGKQQQNITLYLYGVQKKKKNQNQNQHLSNRLLVKIPLYLKQERQGQINSYGDNTNLLTMITIQSLQNQQDWILRSSAFIADASKFTV